MTKTIILRDPEVVELLAHGQATLRRAVKGAHAGKRWFYLYRDVWEDVRCRRLRCPFGAKGDSLACREAYTIEDNREHGQPLVDLLHDGKALRTAGHPIWGEWQELVHYRATDPAPDPCCESPRCRCCGPDGEGYGPHWRSACTMPRWAVRLHVVTRAVSVVNGEWVAEVEVSHEL